MLEEDEETRDATMFEFAHHVLGMIQKWYPQEYLMLQSLVNDRELFSDLREKQPGAIRHLVGYGLIEGTSSSELPEFRMPFVYKFLNSEIGKFVIIQTVIARIM